MPASDARAERRKHLRKQGTEPQAPRTRPYDIDLDEAAWSRLERFADLVTERNRAHNLISRKDAANVWSRHILDSLRLLDAVKGCRLLLDIGSGGGFPGLVLAAALPDCEVTLAERMVKKARFLTTAARLLGLGNVTVWDADVAKLPSEPVFEAVTARAVANVAELWPLAAPRLVSGGELYVFVGADTDAWQNPPGSELRRFAVVDPVNDDSERSAGEVWGIRSI